MSSGDYEGQKMSDQLNAETAYVKALVPFLEDPENENTIKALDEAAIKLSNTHRNPEKAKQNLLEARQELLDGDHVTWAQIGNGMQRQDHLKEEYQRFIAVAQSRGIGSPAWKLD